MQQVALILVGILALGALVLLALQSRRRSPWRGPAAPSRTARASPRFDDLDPGEERSPATSEFGPYRVRPGSSLHQQHWDPYAPEQSSAHRAQATRRARRPERPGRSRRLYAGNVADHYGALGVPPDASLQAIERAYRRTVAQLHPDKHFQDPKKRAQAESDLKRVNQAMHILRDPERRALYDASR